MPRRKVKPSPKPPKRPYRRRERGDNKKTKRPPHPGEAERIAKRSVLSLDLRTKGLSFRAIARQLGVSLHTAWADIEAELMALREETKASAQDVRDIELERCDAMTRGLWPAVEKGEAKAVIAAVRVSERRARLLGLDAPALAKTELSGSLSTSDDAIRKRVLAMSYEDQRAYLAAHDAFTLVQEAILAKADG